MSFPLVRVEWDDAWADHDQVSVGNFAPRWPTETSGRLVRFMGPVISVAQDICDVGGAEEVRCVTHIPVVCVTAIEVLKE